MADQILLEKDRQQDYFYDDHDDKNPMLPDEMARVLERTTVDDEFVWDLLQCREGVLDEYELSHQEKIAILSGDIRWVENTFGPLSDKQKQWFTQRLSAEIW